MINSVKVEHTFLMKTSNIFNINIGLIAGHVLVCHMGSDTWRHLKQRDSVMAGRWLGHLGHPAGSPRHCNRRHHEIANTNSNLVHFLLMTKQCLNVRQKLNFHNFPSLIHSLSRHAEQLLFSCLCLKVTVIDENANAFFYHSLISLSCEFGVHRAGSQLIILL